MKIAVVAPEVFPVPPIRGGAVEAILEHLTAHLRAHEVHVLGIADPALPRREIKGHRTYHRWQPTALDRALLSSWRFPWKRSGSIRYYRPYSRWAAARLQSLRPDVVQVVSRMSFVPWIRKALPTTPVMLSLHQLSSLEVPALWSAERIAQCDLITGCSQFLVDEVRRRYPATDGKVAMLRNGIDPARTRPWWEEPAARERLRRQLGVERGLAVLFVGRLVEQKGAHMLAEAFSRIAQRRPMSRLILVGSHTYSDETPTPYIQQLKQRLAPLGSRVMWAGFRSFDEMASFYAASDLVVVPSVKPETFSMVTLEAMAAGIPVIAFAHGGPAELLRHERTGWLVDPLTGSDGLAQAMERLGEDAALRERLGREARSDVERHWGWAEVADEFLLLCERAQASSRRRGVHSPQSTVHRQQRDIEHASRIVIAESGSGYGGSAKYLSELVSLLDRDRYDVRVVAAHEGPFIARVRVQGVPVLLRPSWRWSAETWSAGGTARAIRRAPGAQTAARMLAQLTMTTPGIIGWLRRERIRLVHLNNELLSHLPLALAARLAGCRVVCHLHGWRPLTRSERAAARLIDAFVCISIAGARFYRGQLPGRDVIAIPNGIHLNGHRPPTRDQRRARRAALGFGKADIVVAMVGRLVPWKGHEVYLDALAYLASSVPTLAGLIVGNDPSADQAYRQRLAQRVRAAGLEARVRWLPWQEDLRAIYDACDIFVQASVKPEPFGLVILEAMAAGKPVIATAAGGVVDVVTDGDTGLLVPPGDAGELSSAIHRLIRDQALATTLAQRAARRVKQSFTMERNAAQVMDVYRQLLTQRVKP